MREIIAMLLAGGKGKRLGAFTRELSKPAILFGGSYRLIDFPLSNCTNSGITSAGVLLGHKSRAPVLGRLLENGQKWKFPSGKRRGLFCLPEQEVDEYRGTADAVYKRFDFIEDFKPQQVLILCTDHVYRMDYRKMLDFHRSRNAELTIAVIQVPWHTASRFGIMSINSGGRIIEFEEKPEQPRSNLASMGIYIFEASTLKKYLKKDQSDPQSAHDFGKNIIPSMMKEGSRVYAYRFEGYWKDVGTLDDFWQANLDLLSDSFKLNDKNWPMYSSDDLRCPEFIHDPKRNINSSLISRDTALNSTVRIENSILSSRVLLGENAVVMNSVLMPGVEIKDNVSIENTLACSISELGGKKQTENELLKLQLSESEEGWLLIQN